jgi:hypothetical protein
MKIFRVCDKDGNVLTSKKNKQGVYFNLPDAKKGLINSLKYINHKLRIHGDIKSRNEGIKAEDYVIKEYSLIEKETYKI